MFYDFTVTIPDVTGKITKKKCGICVHILYEYERVYNKEKKYNIPKRAVIGKDAGDGKMYPNENFFKYFPSSDVVIPEVRPVAYRSSCLRAGCFVVIRKIVEEYKLEPILERRIGEKWGLLLDLASYWIVEEDNASQYYPDYAYNHLLFSNGMRIFSDSTVSRFLCSVTDDHVIRFLDDWNRNRSKKDRIYISYDSTNKNIQAGDVSFAEFGKAKEDESKPIFNLSVAYDRTNRVPLFYEEYPGSINDMSQFTCMVDKAIEYGYRNIGFILDRGYFCKDNITYMDDNGFAFIMMVKGCQTLVSSLVMKHRHSFEDVRDCAIPAYDVYGTTTQEYLYEEDERKRWFHIYYSSYKAYAERDKLEKYIKRLSRWYASHEGQVVSLPKENKYFTFNFSKNGEFVAAHEKKDVISHELSLCGYFCIVTSEKMDATEAIMLYKSRDISEKLFTADKSFLGARSMRAHLDESVSTKLFIEFIALIIRNRIYSLLRRQMTELGRKSNHLTVPAAIRELEKIELVRRNEGIYRLDHALTRTQKEILSSFGISEADFLKEVNELAGTLKDVKNDVTIDKGGEGDGENRIYQGN